MSNKESLYTDAEKRHLLEDPSFITRTGEARELARRIYQDQKATWALCDYLTATEMLNRGINEEITIPTWVLDGVLEKLLEHMLLELTLATGVGPTSLGLAKQTKDRAHTMRYLAVMDLREKGYTLENAYERVAEETGDNPWESKPVKASAIRRSYRDVKKDIEKGGTRFYLPTVPSVRKKLLHHIKLFGVNKSST